MSKNYPESIVVFGHEVLLRKRNAYLRGQVGNVIVELPVFPFDVGGKPRCDLGLRPVTGDRAIVWSSRHGRTIQIAAAAAERAFITDTKKREASHRAEAISAARILRQVAR